MSVNCNLTSTPSATTIVRQESLGTRLQTNVQKMRQASQVDALTPSHLSYIKRQIQKTSLREWQQIWTTTAKGQEYRNTAQRQRDWGPSWKPTKLITGSDQTTASTIHQLRLGNGYFRSHRTTPHNASALGGSKMSSTCSWAADCTKMRDDMPGLPEKLHYTPYYSPREE